MIANFRRQMQMYGFQLVWRSEDGNMLQYQHTKRLFSQDRPDLYKEMVKQARELRGPAPKRHRAPAKRATPSQHSDSSDEYEPLRLCGPEKVAHICTVCPTLQQQIDKAAQVVQIQAQEIAALKQQLHELQQKEPVWFIPPPPPMAVHSMSISDSTPIASPEEPEWKAALAEIVRNSVED